MPAVHGFSEESRELLSHECIAGDWLIQEHDSAARVRLTGGAAEFLN